jgi:sn-1 stearoyl-lipid 9-desaturase
MKTARFGHRLQWNALAIHVVSAIGLYYYFDPIWLLVFLVGNRLIMGIGHDIGMHRYFAHRSFETYRWMEYVFLFFTWFSSQGSTLGWVARHRIHHPRSDLDGDPHPSRDAMTTWLWVDTEAERNVKIPPTLVKDLIRKREHVFMRNHYFKVYWSAIALSAILLGPKFTLYFFLLNGVAGFHTAGLINVLCHRFGYRNFETADRSRNNWLVNVLYPGCGWHNNHHAKPDSYTNKARPWEWDPSGWLIKHVLSTNPRALRDMSTASLKG